jgi:putative ABC transport system substrate-binding protein
MQAKFFVYILAAVLLTTLDRAHAQQQAKVPRIGYVTPTAADPTSPRIKAFQQGLRELGYIEGKNIIVEYRFAEGNPERFPDLVAELVGLKLDIIVVQNSALARAAKKSTTTIPIVMANGGNLFGEGLVASLARPGGNVTGLTNVTRDLGVKRLELLKEILPKLTRVAVLWSPGGRGSEGQNLKEMQTAAPQLQLQLHIMEVRAADDFERAFEGATKARAAALTVTLDPTGLFGSNRNKIVDLAAKKRLPAIYAASRYVDAGGLMSYAADELENHRRAATYVDKILKGAKPAALPIEQPTKFEFVINLKTAKALNMTIPQSVLYRADKVIK